MGRRVLRRASLVIPSSLALLSALSITGRAATLPTASTPTVSVPSTTVAPVPVPGTTVSTPSVTTPAVTTPAVAPTVPATPQKPSVSTVTQRVGSAAGSPSPARPAPGVTGSVATTLVSSGAEAAGRSVAGTSGGSGSAPRSEGSESRAARRVAARHRARETRVLRTLVARDQGCLSALTMGEQRLLALRAGLGDDQAHSATAVARIIHVSSARETHLEERALADLRVQARHGCPATTVAASFAGLNGRARSALVGWIAPAAGSGVGTPNGVTASGSGAGSSLSAGGVTRAAAGRRARHHHASGQLSQGAINVTPVSAGDSLFPIVLGVLGLGAVALLIVALQQRRLRTALDPGGVYSRPLPPPPPPPRAGIGPETEASRATANQAARAGQASSAAGPPAPAVPPSRPPSASRSAAQPAGRPSHNGPARQGALLAAASAGLMRLVGRAASHRRPRR